jgi:hypothetical protein
MNDQRGPEAKEEQEALRKRVAALENIWEYRRRAGRIGVLVVGIMLIGMCLLATVGVEPFSAMDPFAVESDESEMVGWLIFLSLGVVCLAVFVALAPKRKA